MNKGDMVITNDEMWLYAGDTYMALSICAKIPRHSVGIVVSFDNMPMSSMVKVAFPTAWGWADTNYLEKID